MMSKTEIRKKLLEARMNLSESDIAKKSKDAVEIIRKDPFYKRAKTVAIYYPMRGELDFLALLEDSDKIFCFPKIEAKSMRFYRINERTLFQKSKFGVNEPADGTLIDEIDYMIVPAIAISKDRYRIGYGMGFYDYYLSSHSVGHTVGVIYDFSEINRFDVDPHDQQLNHYIKV
jgi:5-formyltetrahydrofolate cyclo-ligase